MRINFNKAIILLSLFAATPAFANNQLDQIIKAAQKEGAVYSIGMPDTWANYADTWNEISTKYKLKHQDTDMSSAEEVAKFEAEKNNATADISDVGLSFAPIAVKKGVAQPYKPTTWNSIPAWAKDKKGNWAVSYTGTIAFITNKKLVKNPPKSWRDLLNGKYRVTIGDVGVAAQANNAVLAAAFALGGNEKNIKPALDFFAKLAKQGRLVYNDPSLASLEKGEVEVGVIWDFNALGYSKKINAKQFAVSIPTDGSVTSGYSTIINKYAKHPNAAKLTREYLFSDKGQINFAKGFARPIRRDVILPKNIQANLLPNSEYKNAKPITHFEDWKATSAKLQQLWQENVLTYSN